MAVVKAKVINKFVRIVFGNSDALKNTEAFSLLQIKLYSYILCLISLLTLRLVYVCDRGRTNTIKLVPQLKLGFVGFKRKTKYGKGEIDAN